MDNFSIVALELCPVERLDMAESNWILFYNSVKRGYNMVYGNCTPKKYKEKSNKPRIYKTGYHPWVGRKHSEESIKKISISKTGKIYGPETRAKLSALRKGKPTWNKGKESVHSQKKVEKFDIITGATVETFKSIKEAAKMTNGNRNAIAFVCRGERKKSGGFGWRFVDVKQNST
jgi:group I intron endonuclease